MNSRAETVTSAKIADFGDQPQTLANGVVGEIIHFESSTPATYATLIAGDHGPKITLYAQLFLPREVRSHFPVVIVCPGSTGVNKSQITHANTLATLGIAAFLIDPFTPRSIMHTYADQTQLTTCASAFDVLAAARYLLTRGEIDARRIGALGGSRGGIAVLHAAMRPLSKAVLPPGRALRCVLAQYPSHLYQFRDPDIGDTEVRIVMGDSDKWTLLSSIQGYENAIRLNGGTVSLRVWPDAEHSFDRPELPVTLIPDGIATPTCPVFYLNDAGVFFNYRTGEYDATVTELEIRRDVVKRFPRIGVPIGSRGRQPEEFRQDMIAFFKRTLLTNPA